jgi:hypothetical protein
MAWTGTILPLSLPVVRCKCAYGEDTRTNIILEKYVVKMETVTYYFR